MKINRGELYRRQLFRYKGGIMGKISKAYEGLGNSKAQRFRRFFLILFLIAGVICYGFNRDKINISINGAFGGASSNGQDK